MLSWYRLQLWVFYFLCPLFFLLVPGFLPTLELKGKTLGGGPIREWAVNHLFMPVLNDSASLAFTQFWYSTGVVGESGVYALIVLNVFALCVPVFYGAGCAQIYIINRYKTSSYRAQRGKLKRSGAH